jgi:ABC-type multidrug transport system fused ATPase/permease subunit
VPETDIKIQYALKDLLNRRRFYIGITIVEKVSIVLEHTFMAAYIIDCMEKGRPFSSIFWFVVPVTLVILFRLIYIPYLDAYILPKHREKITRDIRMTLYQKAAEMDIAKYDAPEFYTVIIISHRLSTTWMVDTIYMLENGRIIEHGTHSELIALGGKYAEMFRLQAEKYR